MQSDPAEDQDDPPVKYNLKTVPACRRKKQDHEQPVLHCHTCPDHDRHPAIPGHIPHAQEHDSTQDRKNDQGINDQTDPKEQCGLPRDGACISDVFVHIYKCDRPKDQDHRKEKCSCKIHTGLFCIRHMLPPIQNSVSSRISVTGWSGSRATEIFYHDFLIYTTFFRYRSEKNGRPKDQRLQRIKEIEKPFVKCSPASFLPVIKKKHRDKEEQPRFP